MSSMPLAVLGCGGLVAAGLIAASKVKSNSADKRYGVLKEVVHDCSSEISKGMKEAAEAHGRGMKEAGEAVGRGMKEAAEVIKEAAKAHGQGIKEAAEVHGQGLFSSACVLAIAMVVAAFIQK